MPDDVINMKSTKIRRLSCLLLLAPSLTARAEIYSFTTVAGVAGSPGSTDGAANVARFSSPSSVALDRSGNIYVADTGNHTIRKITPAGVVTTLAGTAGLSGSTNGTGGAARFFSPQAVAVDRDGNVLVADTRNSTIRKITPAGVVTTLAGVVGGSGGHPPIDGPASTATFWLPRGLAVDAVGTVLVADYLNNRIRKISPDGFVTSLPQAFNDPLGVAVDDRGTISATDNFFQVIRKIAVNGDVETFYAGTGQRFSPLVFGGLAVDGSALVFITNSTIRRLRADGTMSDLTGADGADSVGIRFPRGVAVDSGGNVFVCAEGGHTIHRGAPVSNPARLINVSVLAALADRSDTVTLGTIIGGSGATGAQPLLLRAAGPSLAPFGVTGLLADPGLELYSNRSKTGENDDWGGAANLSALFTQVGAFPFSSSTSKDAALAAPTVPMGSTTVLVSGRGSAGGSVLAELYEATPVAARTPTTPRLINVSVLQNVGAGLSVGFVIDGIGRKTVLIRAVGPSLARFGVTGVLADPKLELFDGQSRSIGANDDWRDTVGTDYFTDLVRAFTEVGAFELTSFKDAALLVTLAPGLYSVQVRSGDSTTGTALTEIYEVP